MTSPDFASASPKSMMCGARSSSIMMLAGFRSRCTTPFSWAWCSASAISRKSRPLRDRSVAGPSANRPASIRDEIADDIDRVAVAADFMHADDVRVP